MFTYAWDRYARTKLLQMNVLSRLYTASELQAQLTLPNARSIATACRTGNNKRAG